VGQTPGLGRHEHRGRRCDDRRSGRERRGSRSPTRRLRSAPRPFRSRPPSSRRSCTASDHKP